MDELEVFNDVIDLFGGDKADTDDGFIYYGKLKLSVAPKEGKAITMLANALFSPSILLAEHIEIGLISVGGRSVVELGAGCALPSLLAAILPNAPARIVVTDYPDDLILANLRQNVEQASVHAADPSVVRCVGYEWGTDVSPILALLPSDAAGYDVVMMSDLLHFNTSHGVLVSSLTKLLSKSRDSRAYVAAGKYTRSEVCDNFVRLARAAGIVMEEQQTSGEWRGTMEVRGGGLNREQLGLRKEACRMWIGQWDDTGSR